jgi:hypothetical protein
MKRREYLAAHATREAVDWLRGRPLFVSMRGEARQIAKANYYRGLVDAPDIVDVEETIKMETPQETLERLGLTLDFEKFPVVVDGDTVKVGIFSWPPRVLHNRTYLAGFCNQLEAHDKEMTERRQKHAEFMETLDRQHRAFFRSLESSDVEAVAPDTGLPLGDDSIYDEVYE